MQTDFGNHAQKPNPIVIPELDELQFKAIGEGLGFHQQDEKPRWKSASPTSSSASFKKSGVNPSIAQSSVNVSREQLGMIYGNAPAKEVSSVKTKSKVKTVVKQASLSERLTAQVVDTVIVCAVVAAMLGVMLMAAQVPMTQAKSLLTSLDVAPVVGILWLFAYTFYFTILETRQTPGKSLMRLKVVGMNAEPLTLSRSLERTVFRTLSWLALGFPLIMDFHGRLSRTQVIRA